MIRLLKNVRMKFLSQGRVVKYVTYAIGEIILVALGILLAFYLDSRATEQERTQQYDFHLNRLKIELDQSIKDLNFSVKRANNMVAHLAETQQRLFSADANRDTLVLLTQAFNPCMSTRTSGFDETIESLIVSGDIELFDQETTRVIQNLKRRLRYEKRAAENNTADYNTMLISFLEHYHVGHDNCLPKVTPDRSLSTMDKRAWERVDQDLLFARLASLLDIKRVVLHIYARDQNRMVNLMKKVRDHLNSLTDSPAE